MTNATICRFVVLLLLAVSSHSSPYDGQLDDKDILEFHLNLEFLKAELFLNAALGHGLGKEAPELVKKGPAPKGVKKATLDDETKDIITQFGYQQVGHIKAIVMNGTGFPRPLMNLSSKVFGKVINEAYGVKLDYPFDPYEHSLNFLLACYILSYDGFIQYIDTVPIASYPKTAKLLAKLLSVASAQDTVIRDRLYRVRNEKVKPYDMTVANFTDMISRYRSQLAGNPAGTTDDEGITVDPSHGAEEKISGNVIAGNRFSLPFERTMEQVLKVLYLSGKPNKTGGFFPNGASGDVANYYLYNQ